MKLADWMKSVYACGGATRWVGDRTPEQSWNECERADWMLWAAARSGVDRKQIVRVAVDCAISVLHLTTDARVAEGINVVQAWCEGKATIEQVRVARQGAADAAAAYAAYAAYAANANAAAYAANAAADAAAYAAYAAYAAADAANAAADAARQKSLKEMCELVRARITAEEFSAAVVGGGK